MDTLSGGWVVGLGLFALLLALVWQSWFPGLTDSAPEVLPTDPPPPAVPPAGACRSDLPG